MEYCVEWDIKLYYTISYPDGAMLLYLSEISCFILGFFSSVFLLQYSFIRGVLGVLNPTHSLT